MPENLYGWSYSIQGSISVCPRLRASLEAAQKEASEHYVRRDREKYPETTPQELEWREQTSPRGYGFGTRFWGLYAARRVRSGYKGAMAFTGYRLYEMTKEEE